jgi:flavin reductase (DIM6/NTAB) family NADH-FMN oxidoreductase RutF
MELDFAKLSPSDRYKFLCAVVVPRPIAWVTTVSTAGVVNVAPFSFFNAMGSQPAIVALGIITRGKGVPKDSFKNIQETREFVVNLVTFAAREPMNRTAADFPPEVSELSAVGLETRPALTVKPPRLALSPVHLECKLATIVEVGRNHVTIGEVIHASIADAYYDPVKGYVATQQLDLIGRMHGRGWYARTTDLFEMPRVNPDGSLA